MSIASSIYADHAEEKRKEWLNDGWDITLHNSRRSQPVAPLAPVTCSPVRAFSVVVTAWIPEVESIVAATSAAKAKFKAWKAAHDAGYDLLKFGDFRVRRAPEFDVVAHRLKHCVDRTYTALLMQRENGPDQRPGRQPKT